MQFESHAGQRNIQLDREYNPDNFDNGCVGPQCESISAFRRRGRRGCVSLLWSSAQVLAWMEAADRSGIGDFRNVTWMRRRWWRRRRKQSTNKSRHDHRKLQRNGHGQQRYDAVVSIDFTGGAIGESTHGGLRCTARLLLHCGLFQTFKGAPLRLLQCKGHKHCSGETDACINEEGT